MCGIAGIWSRQESGGLRLGRMLDLMKHRGPDDEGALSIVPATGKTSAGGGPDSHPALDLPSFRNSSFRGELLLGHRRLSILDLSESGHQPMADPSGRYWLTYNGEIYNYLELRTELEANGFRFRSRSDSEVLLQAFACWGPDCLNRFNGMWSFAIYDTREKVLFCSRDRFGIKPFYYAQSTEAFIFASEIKPLLAAGIPAAPDEEAVFRYLLFGQSHTSGNTFFEGIHELKAGHCLEIREGRAAQEKRWYQPCDENLKYRDLKEASGQLRNLLEDAVSLRLRSDVPAGGSLSGGLDSSAITALCRRRHPGDFSTFTAAYLGYDKDESAYAAEVALRAGARPHYVYPSGHRLWRELNELVTAQEEPFGSTSIYAQWCVMRKAREEAVPVLLDGQGADELFAGYHRYRMNAALEARHPGRILSALVVPYGPQLLANTLLGAGRAGSGLSFLKGAGLLNADFLPRMRRSGENFMMRRLETQASLNRTLEADLTNYSLPALLRYADRNSMQFSVEVRLPFLDYRIVALARSLPAFMKIQGRAHKIVLRQACEGLIPQSVQSRTDKTGFATPEGDWLRPAAALLDKNIQSGGFACERWLDKKRLASFVKTRRAPDSLIWRIINLETWMKQLVEPGGKRTRENTYSLPVLSS